MNNVILVGHLGKDAELITTKSGTSMVKLLIATRPKYRNKVDGREENSPDWHKVLVKGKLAQTCVRCKKGMKVAISGYLHNHSWIDSNGEKKYSYEVVAEEVEFHSPLGPRDEE